MAPKRESIDTGDFRHERRDFSPPMSAEEFANSERLYRVLTESADSLHSNLGALTALPPDERKHAIELFILDVMNGARGPHSSLRFSDEPHPATDIDGDGRPKGMPIIGGA